MIARAGRALGAGLLSLLVTGCTETPTVTRNPSSPTSTASSQPVASAAGADGARLATLRQAAGLAPCPTSDPVVARVAGGLPDLTLSCLGGGRAVRLAGLRGRPLLVNVWAQWCGPCRQEAPYLAEVSKTSTSQLLILGVDFADPRPEYALEFARTASWRYPQLQDVDKQLASTLQVSAPPQTLFIRADGRIAYRHAGAFQSAQQIRDLARTHLGVAL